MLILGSIQYLLLFLPRVPRRAVLTFALFVALALSLALAPSLVRAFAGFGDYISEKMLGDGTNESLYLGDGTNELMVLGSGPVIVTLAVSDQSAGSAVLNGTLVSLNGLPRADVWFEWGYSASGLTHTTPVVTVSSVGSLSATASGITGGTVYYRVASSTDGTSRGEIMYFSSGRGTSNWFMNTLLPTVIAASILVFLLLATGSPIAAVLGAITGLIAFYIVKAVVDTL